MCTHCGCSAEKASLSDPVTAAVTPATTLSHDHKTLHLQQALLSGNDEIASQNRTGFERAGTVCVNLMGTPGAGKTALLEAIFRSGAISERTVGVLEGDQQTSNDAQRITNAGGRALQINTGTGCHLDAQMIQAGVNALSMPERSLLVIENVGNLVCPALFDLGETLRIALMSVTDGDDKPVKYPYMFSQCDLVIVNKTDLLPYVDFDMHAVSHALSHLNPDCPLIAVSARTGEGMNDVIGWLKDRLPHD